MMIIKDNNVVSDYDHDEDDVVGNVGIHDDDNNMKSASDCGDKDDIDNDFGRQNE